MYTISSLAHIVESNTLQALIKFQHNGKDQLTTAIVSVSTVGSDLETIYLNQSFVDACNTAINERKLVLENPIG